MATERSSIPRTLEREQRLDALLAEVFERPEEEQTSFLEDACGGDAALLAEARACLTLEKELSSFLEMPAIAGMLSPQTETRIFLEPTGLENTLGELAETDREDSIPKADEPTRSLPSEDSWLLTLGKRRLGAYKIIGHLGAGGMGQVYLGEDTRLGRRIAVKTLPPEMATHPGWLERFEREARALATLNHPHIVTIHSIEEDRGVRFLTMERVEGKTLQETIPKNGLPLEDFLRIATELTDALAAAHEQGVIHRDLKPANVMITRSGRVKILDFGIAKVSGKIAGAAAGEEPPALSQEGFLIGTVSYMAPEQLKSQLVDARSDLFSLGVVLYLMATGHHPFPSRGALNRIPAILNDEPAAVHSIRQGLPEAASKIIVRCLEKDPEERYQSADELLKDLEELHRTELTAKIFLDQPKPRRNPLKQPQILLLTVTLFLVIALLAIGWGRLHTPALAPTVAGEKTQAEAQRHGLAVLFFQNLTGAPELDWLSTGIPELLVTDLSQSPGLDVLGTSEVHRILTDLGARNQISLAPEVVLQAAVQGKVETVIRGSYARLGDVLRVAYSIEIPATGENLYSESLEGQGEESLFALVDQMSTSVLRNLDTSRPEMGPATVQEATTASVSAWQAFSESVILYRIKSKPEEAIERLEDALRADPEFALAFVAMAKYHQSLGHTHEAQTYARKAFDLKDRLPLDTRFSAESNYYGNRWATTGRAIETYDLALKVYSHKDPWRNNLARRYAFFERYADAIQEFQQLIDSGSTYWGNYHGVATSQAALGDFEAGERLLAAFADKHPENWWLHYALAWHLTDWNKFDQASEAFERVAALRPDSPQLYYGRWRLAALREEWAQAKLETQRLLDSEDSFGRFRGNISRSRNALYDGQSAAALAALDAAIEVATGADRALARCFKAELLLARGEAKQALLEARQAQQEGAEQWPELRGYYLAALAEQALGRPRAADALRETLQERWRRQPNAVEERQLHHLSARLALARGETKAALTDLERAAALLPANGIEFSWHVFPDHIPIWTALGEAELAQGQPKAALAWLKQAEASGSEHLEQPVAYVRGFYLQGLAHRARGEQELARRALERFLGYWAGGDLDPDSLAKARFALLNAEDSGAPAPEPSDRQKND